MATTNFCEAPPVRRYLIGPDRDGHWLVRDCEGRSGALFKDRADALHFAKAECEALGSARSGWRFVAALDLGDIFAPASGGGVTPRQTCSTCTTPATAFSAPASAPVTA